MSIKKILDQELNRTTLLIQRNIALKRHSTGKTERSVVHKSFVRSSRLVGQIWAADYIGDLETGVPPKPGWTFMDRNDLAFELFDWSAAKPIFSTDRVGMSYAMATVILDDGSKTWRAGNFVNIFHQEIEELKRVLPKRLSVDITKTLARNLDGKQITLW